MTEELQRPGDGGTVVNDGVEYAEDGGELLEIVHPVPATDLSALSPQESRAMLEIYKIVSRLLPLEGRDYALHVSFPSGDPSRPAIRFEPRNELGILWCQYISKRLPEEVRKLQKGQK